MYQKNCHARDEHIFFHVNMHYNTSKDTFHKNLSILGKRTPRTFFTLHAYWLYSQINYCSALVSNINEIQNVVELQ